MKTILQGSKLAFNYLCSVEKKIYQDNFRIGLLGGGQLGRMLIQEAANLNLNISVLDPDPNAPCLGISKEFKTGSLTSFQDVYEFGKDKDLLTIEIENVNIDALKKLNSEGKTVYPSPEIIEIVQDKGLQKEFYERHKIPSSPFVLCENKDDLVKNIEAYPFVQKLRKGGYDGKGVLVVKSEDELNSVFDSPSVLEKAVEIEKEISIIVARNPHGEIKLFPVVEMIFNQKANLVEYLLCPADISLGLRTKAEELAYKVAKSLDLIGILAIEMFLTKDEEILVNEVAPRPHNSGHSTIEANFTSQYEQHLRSILGLPLGDCGLLCPSVMVNLLGEEGYEGEAIYENLNEILKIEGSNVHLYGKQITKPFRKMGHVTILDKSVENAKLKADKVKTQFKCIS